ncbi:TPA: O-antigen ligase family protein [Streptococcus pneumoniae]
MKIRIEPQYFLYKYLWFIILLPKQFMQLILFFLIALTLLPTYIKEKQVFKIDTPSFCMVLWTIIYSISIIFNSLIDGLAVQVIFSDLSKAFNWLIAVFFYNYYLKMPINIDRIKRYMYYNFTILVVFVGLFYIQRGSNVILSGRSLLDWDGFTLATSYGVRYTGFLEYATLNGQLILFLLPLIRLFRFRFFTQTIIFAFLLEVLVLSKSRIAIVAMLIYIAFAVVNEINSNNKWLIGIFCPIIPFMLFYNFEKIKQIFFQMFSSRSGSNATRFRVYEESLKAINGMEMLLGAGVRIPSTVDILLGSHSMYISFIYRTGVLGSIIITVMFYYLFSKFLKCDSSERLRSIGYILALSVFWLFEELDPHYWCLILFFSTISIFINNRKEEIVG